MDRVLVLRSSVEAQRRSERKAREERGFVVRTIAQRVVGDYAAACEAKAVEERQRRGVVDAVSAQLVLRYGALCLLERAAVAGSELHADDQRREGLECVESRRRLLLFGAHLERETRGAATVRRLPDDDPQRVRCARAARENVKRQFFRTSSHLNVVDVYKIDNAPLLEKFHAATTTAAAAAKRRHVTQKKTNIKGLFCAVPSESLERVCVYGFRGDADADDLAPAFFSTHWLLAEESSSSSSSSSPPQENGAPDEQQRGGAAQRAASSVPAADFFPRKFSRYSTLSELDDADAAIQFLALCRVYVGEAKVFFTEKQQPPKHAHHRADDDDDDDDATPKDSYYDPHAEEYVVLDAEHVLPEFVVAYRFVPKRSPADEPPPVPTSPEPPFAAALRRFGIDSLRSSTRGAKRRTESTGFPPDAATLLAMEKQTTNDDADEEEDDAVVDWGHVVQRLPLEKRAILRALARLFSDTLPEDDDDDDVPAHFRALLENKRPPTGEITTTKVITHDWLS